MQPLHFDAVIPSSLLYLLSCISRARSPSDRFALLRHPQRSHVSNTGRLAAIHTIMKLLHIEGTMRTNIEIDDHLMSKAMRSSGARTKKAVVEAGLRLLVKTHSQAVIRKLRTK